jgi:hypothetical protein
LLLHPPKVVWGTHQSPWMFHQMSTGIMR